MTLAAAGHYRSMLTLRWHFLPLLALAAGEALAQDALGGSTPETRFTPPPGFVRAPCAPHSFCGFLRQLPLKPPGAEVLLHHGAPKNRQDAHAAVLDITVERKDLQQCADAVMRLRAEHLFANGRQDEIAFRFTNGFRAEWKRWRNGERIRVSGNRAEWIKGAGVDSSHAQLMRYMETVFQYAGTRSLEQELWPANGPVQPGDVFIQGGSPGHAAIVLDAARHADGRVAFLLAQSYMPAQDIHVLLNPAHPELGAWYIHQQGGRLVTPEWTFDWQQRRHWP